MPVFGILTAAVQSCVSVSCDAQKKGGQGSKLHSANSRQARFNAHAHTLTGIWAWPRLLRSYSSYEGCGAVRTRRRKEGRDARAEEAWEEAGYHSWGLEFLLVTAVA